MASGGTHLLESLELCCGACNRAKWHYSKVEFMAWLMEAAERLRSEG
ncbi:hypothetical protein [Deinococcus soli Cha et al. 2016]